MFREKASWVRGSISIKCAKERLIMNAKYSWIILALIGTATLIRASRQS